jgi:YHS domain-containing protein
MIVADLNSRWFSLPTKGAVMLVSSLTLFRQIFAICLLSLFVGSAALADSPIAAVNTEHGLAVKGYDPVSYFTTGKPTPGLAQFSTIYKGATYRFSSAENRDRFIATPEKFVPQYGGYCAYAVSLNKIADIEPDEWAIVNDKLYLNNGFLAQSLWSLDKSGNIVRGDRNWPLIPKLGNP